MRSSNSPYRVIGWAGAALCILSTLAASTTLSNGQTLLLKWNFDEADSGSADALDAGASPAANGVLLNAARTNNTPDDFSVGALNTTGAAASNLKYVIATDDNGEADKLDNLASFTLTAWINVQEAPSGNRRLLAKQNGAPNYEGFTWNVADAVAGGTRAANNFGLRLFVGGSAGFKFDTSAVTIDADNKWAFVALTYDGASTTDNVTYYVGDSQTAATSKATTTVDAGTTSPSTAAFGVGYTAAAATANTAFPGLVDDVRVYSGVLTSEQIDLVRKENLPSGSASLPVTLRDVARNGTTVTFSFDSQADKSYDVEYKDSLGGAWNPLTTIPGNGGTVNASDTTATGNVRFYRVITN
jgi:hypothetical protein